MEDKDRSSIWKEIWIKKGENKNISLLLADGYAGLLSQEEYEHMVEEVINPLCLTGDESVVECGCGAGLFLNSLLKVHPRLKISGIDYSTSLIEIARAHFNSDFYVSDMTDISMVGNGIYDVSLSFGAMHYLSSLEAATKALSEMARITKPGGKIYIGEVPDAEKKEMAESIRKVSHQALEKVSSANPDHLYIPKSLFYDYADQTGMNIQIIDHDQFNLGNYQAAKYRYSIYLEKIS